VACITATSAKRRSPAPAVFTTIGHASQVQPPSPSPFPDLHRDYGVTAQGHRLTMPVALPPTRPGGLGPVDGLTDLRAAERVG
jgi:hypothetical protein